MSRFLVYIFVYLSLISYLGAQSGGWVLVNPIPTQGTLNSVFSITPDDVWAVSSDGTVYQTSDGGENWINVDFGAKEALTSVFFFDKNYGWIVGANSIVFRTENGGKTWKYSPLPYDKTKSLRSVFFVSPTTGWVTGAVGHISKTTDGGMTWKDQSKDIDHIHSSIFFKAFFISETTGWLVGQYSAPTKSNAEILKTTNGGESWVSTSFDSLSSLSSIVFTSPTLGYAFGYGNKTGGVILKTTNAGIDWTSKLINTEETQNITSSTFISSTLGWAIGEGGYKQNIYKTTDGGDNWLWQVSVLANSYTQLSSISFGNSSIGYAVGVYGTILKTIDGGNSWTKKNSTITDYQLNSLSFVSKTDGFIAAGDFLLKTRNGGKTWDKKKINLSDHYINKLSFISETLGWVTCTHQNTGQSKILKTTDGGENWVNKFSPGNYNLDQIQFISSTIGWAGGEISFPGGSRKIYRTTDGGETWIDPGEIASSLGNFYFVTSEIGWVIKKGGYDESDELLKTTDGGTTWTVQTNLPRELSLHSLFFISPTTGWAYGFNGKIILKTTDGGNTWMNQSSGTRFPTSALYFISSTKGWGVAGNDIIFTNDGGNTWEKQAGGTGYLHNVFFASPDDGWIVGGSGLILRTSTGGSISSFKDNYSNSLPINFSLSQNYPNPFNPTTTIQYSIPNAGHVSLKVYDLIGREVEILVDEYRNAGIYNYELSIHNSQLSSGIYFYRLQCGNFSETKKLVLMK